MIQALAQSFIFVTLRDDFKNYTDEKYILIDDYQSYAGMLRQQWISILDSDQARSMNAKHGTVIIPKGIRRIITINTEFSEINPFSSDEAITRRVLIVKIFSNAHLYKKLEPVESKIPEVIHPIIQECVSDDRK